MALIDENLIKDLIEEYGSTAILKRIDGASTFNRYGEETVNYFPEEEVKVIVTSMAADSKYVTEGLYSPDDKSFFIKGETTIQLGDIFTHKGTTYKVSYFIDAELEDFVHVHEVIAKKI